MKLCFLDIFVIIGFTICFIGAIVAIIFMIWVMVTGNVCLVAGG